MSNDLALLKKRIFDDERIEELLEKLDCWNISTEQYGTLFVAGLPDGDNPRSVQIKDTESLNSTIRSKNITGDIFDIVNYIIYDINTKEESTSNLNKAKLWICNNLNYPEFIDAFYRDTAEVKYEKPKSALAWLKNVKKKKKVELKNKPLTINYEQTYGIIPNLKWYEEGLSIATQLYFEVGYDISSERLTFPIYNSEGELIGVKGRYIGKDKHIEDNYKYLYLEKCNKSLELFNFHRAKYHAEHLGELIILEGAKSVKFLHQWGVYNTVSMEGDTLSEAQVELLKELPLDTRYVIAMDKDKSAKEVKDVIDQLKGRIKYGIIDNKDLLSHKDSPVDKGKFVWETLYNECMFKIN